MFFLTHILEKLSNHCQPLASVRRAFLGKGVWLLELSRELGQTNITAVPNPSVKYAPCL